jgi:hypothetical protein
MIARWNISFSALLLLVVIGLSGCKVDSIHPISAVDATRPDPALAGLWRYKAKGDLAYVHIGPEFSLNTSDAAAGPAKGTRIIVIDHKRNGITDEAYIAYPSRIGKQRYLNVVQVEGGKPVGFVLVQYAFIDNSTLRFSMMNEDALKAAIASGQIKGESRGEGLTSETVITAESADIEAFLGRYGGKLFTNPFVLRRVPDR